MSVVAVCSGKGSPGATFVAVNLAAALARTRERVMLVDVDPAGGDIAAYLGLDPHRGLYPLLRMDRGASDTNAMLREAQERLGVLAVGGFPVEASAESRDALPALMDRMREHGSVVVADVGRVSEHTAGIAARAEVVLLVVRPDLVSVLGAERTLRALQDAGGVRDRVRLVVSGAERHRPGDLAEVSTALKVEVLCSIPFARREARRGLVQQAPVAKGRLAKAFKELASSVLDSNAKPRVEACASGLVEVPA
ncbi:MAG: AAA family ATPase [Actinomycetota bacterium]